MPATKALFTYPNLVLLVWALVPVGLIFAPFLLSVCMIATVVLALYHPDPARRWAIGLRKDLGMQLRGFSRRTDLWVLMLFFWLSFWGVWGLEDPAYLTSRLRIKVPFLVLPLAFFLLPRPSARAFEGLLAWLLLLLSLTGLGILINYAFHYEAVNELLKQGQAMPQPANHIRFSLLVSFGLLAAAYLYFSGELRRRYRFLGWLLPALGVFLFVLLHLLAVRSGIVGAYFALALLGLWYILRSRQYMLFLGLVFTGIAVPFLAYETVPSLRTKLGYVGYELEKLRRGEQELQLSDAGRLVSLQIGWQVYKSAPLLGVGTGDLKKEVQTRYAKRFPESDPSQRRMPHNQFLSVLAATGPIGLLLFVAAFLWPLFYRKNYQHWLLLGFYGIVFFSLLVENTIENAMGVGFFIFYLPLLLVYFNEKADHLPSSAVAGTADPE